MRTSSKKAQYKRILVGSLVVAPLVLNIVFAITQDGSLSRYSYVPAMIITLWLVRQWEHNGGKVSGLPSSTTEKREALIFGVVKTLGIVILFWLPKGLHGLNWKNEVVGFIIFAKVTAYMDYAYWLIRLSCSEDTDSS